MLDRILATISFLLLVAFVGLVLVYVMIPDLWIVTFIVLAIGIYFFWQDIRAADEKGNGKAQGNGSEG